MNFLTLIPLGLAVAIVLGLSVAMICHPEWFADDSPAYDECVCYDDEHADLEPLRADFFDKGPIPPWKDAELQHFRLWREELRRR